VVETIIFHMKLFCDFASQKLSQSVSVSQSYSKNKSGTVILRHGVDLLTYVRWQKFDK